MTKADLMKEFNDLEESKDCHIEGIYWNSKKDQIQNAIDCLNCSDEMLDKYLIVLLSNIQIQGAQSPIMEISNIIATTDCMFTTLQE